MFAVLWKLLYLHVWYIFAMLCTFVLFAAGTTTLTPPIVSACPTVPTTLTCTSTDSSITIHRWIVSAPQHQQLMGDVSDQSGRQAFSLTPPGDTNFRYNLMLVSTSPLVSTLTTTMAMDGTMVECLSGPGGTAGTAMISITGS